LLSQHSIQILKYGKERGGVSRVTVMVTISVGQDGTVLLLVVVARNPRLLMSSVLQSLQAARQSLCHESDAIELGLLEENAGKRCDANERMRAEKPCEMRGQ
jgi:hypothetical protein